MKINEPFILKVIQLRKKQNDNPKQFATRNKASPINKWSNFEPFSEEAFQKVFNNKFDGLKLKFNYVTLLINGRHKSK
jgi:hypothetical protein